MNPLEQVSPKDIRIWNQVANELSKMDDPLIQKTMTDIFPGHKKGDEYRLPTEAEWEFVARLRGLATGDYAHGNTDKDLGDYAWFRDNAGDETHPVGLKKPIMINRKPIYDMYGNVWELLADRYGNTLPGGVDPQGHVNSFLRPIRGAGWVYSAESLTSAPGGQVWYDKSAYHVGFRLVRDIP